MLALTLMVGIVIDDAIIVLENIFRFMEEKDMPPFQAAIEGTQEIGLAVMATTLSLLAVFLPVGFMGGIVGPLHELVRLHLGLRHRGLAAGLVHADARCSARASSSRPRSTAKTSTPRRTRRSSTGSTSTTRACSKWAMAHRKTMVAMCVLVVLSIVPLFMFVGKNFLPEDDQSQFNVLVRTPEGTSLAATTTIAEEIAQDVRRMPGVSAHSADRRRQRR